MLTRALAPLRGPTLRAPQLLGSSATERLSSSFHCLLRSRVPQISIRSQPLTSSARKALRPARSPGQGGSGWGTGFRRLGFGALYVGAGTVCGLALSRTEAPPSSHFSASCEAPAEDEVVDLTQFTPFDRNWDGRQPQEGEEKATAVRYIVLIRHGQYNDKAKKDSDAILTLNGRQQARTVAKMIAGMPWKIAKVYVSDMTRAHETFDILMEELPNDTATQEIPELREGRPCQPIPPSKSGAYKVAQIQKDGERIDKAFRDIFYRADVSQKENSYEIVVGHANVFRYYVCKALQIPTEAWLRMGLPHCSVTLIAIHPSGSVSLRMLGNTHYLSPNLITYS